MTPKPAPPNFPLRWESIGDQWWYASPIDWAAANGLYDVVRELLHLDTNLLIKLTSLRRIRRLETVWDDDDRRLAGVSANRARVARKLLEAAWEPGGRNSLIRAGYGGWLLYTAAAAGDAGFVRELLDRDPLLVYGEGEYGLTDLLYAAARGRSPDVFRMLVGSALALPEESGGGAVGEELRWEVVNRAAHAAARGGNVAALGEILEENGGGEGVLRFKDDQGCSLLHSGAGRGQVEVVKYLIENFDSIVGSTDNQGNTALHVAAHRGFLPVVKLLITASPSLVASRNTLGDTFLHMAVAGFRAPGFRRLDKLLGLVGAVLSGEFAGVEGIVNARNADGRTALHAAVAENAHIGLVELLMSAPGINLNVRDFDGMTPLDLLKRRPRSASSEILIKQLISAGGISNSRDHTARKALVSQLKNHGIGTSPGTSFRIPDGEIFLFTGIENVSDHPDGDNAGAAVGTFSGRLSHTKNKKKSVSVDYSANHLNFLLKWPKKKDKKSPPNVGNSLVSMESRSHVPLRQKYSNRTHSSSAAESFPSPWTKMKFAAGLTHGVIKTAVSYPVDETPASSSALSGSGSGSWSPEIKTCGASNNRRGEEEEEEEEPGPVGMRVRRQGEALDEKAMMNEFLCFGAQECGQDSISCRANYSSSSLVV